MVAAGVALAAATGGNATVRVSGTARTAAPAAQRTDEDDPTPLPPARSGDRVAPGVICCSPEVPAMSLVSEIRNPRSPVTMWLRATLPNHRGIQRAYRQATGPLRIPIPAGGTPGTVGAAINHRLRAAPLRPRRCGEGHPLLTLRPGNGRVGAEEQRVDPGGHVRTRVGVRPSASAASAVAISLIRPRSDSGGPDRSRACWTTVMPRSVCRRCATGSASPAA